MEVINCQVITESGQLLGRVLDFHSIETGDLISLVMGAVGVPLLGEGVLSTWEIPVEEIVSSGTDRIIVYEGAEEKLNQLSSGLLEKLGVGGVLGKKEKQIDIQEVLYQLRINCYWFGVKEQNDLVDDFKEEVVDENNDYEDNLEYVELDGLNEEVSNKKLYLENEDSEDSSYQTGEKYQIDKDIIKDSKKSKPSRSNLASKRPIQRTNETLDIEPLDEKNLVTDNKQKEIFEIDDPW